MRPFKFSTRGRVDDYDHMMDAARYVAFINWDSFNAPICYADLPVGAAARRDPVFNFFYEWVMT